MFHAAFACPRQGFRNHVYERMRGVNGNRNRLSDVTSSFVGGVKHKVFAPPLLTMQVLTVAPCIRKDSWGGCGTQALFWGVAMRGLRKFVFSHAWAEFWKRAHVIIYFHAVIVYVAGEVVFGLSRFSLSPWHTRKKSSQRVSHGCLHSLVLFAGAISHSRWCCWGNVAKSSRLQQTRIMGLSIGLAIAFLSFDRV